MKIFSTALKLICAFSIAVHLFVMVSPAAMAQPIGPAALEYNAIPCSWAFNPCGNPSQCLCPEEYSYDASVGSCLIDDLDMADGPGKSVESKCTFPPQGPCTLDINVAGNPSICACPGGTEYSPVIGQCVILLPY